MSVTAHPQAGMRWFEEGVPRGCDHPPLVHACQPNYIDRLPNIAACNLRIVKFPAPIDAAMRPDFDPLIKLSEAVGTVLNAGDTMIDNTTNLVAILFNKLGIDTLDVLEAAGTKWNFLPFRPGLVGGHCISVDPYYLTQQAKEVGHHSVEILAGGRTNDGMGSFVAEQGIKLLVRKGINPVEACVLVLRLAFKENTRACATPAWWTQ